MSRLLVAQRALTVPGWAKDELSRKAQAIPSLDLRFADNKSLVDATTGSNLVTFTRASSGTFVDSAGVLQTAVTDAPRFDHNPTTGESLGLLVEEQRSNLLQRSEEFSDAYWFKSAATITSNAITAPDGQATADLFTEDSSTSQHDIRVTSPTFTDATAYTISIYGKANGRQLQIIFPLNTAGHGAIFDLTNGTFTIIGNTVSASILPVGNGWYRCICTATKAGGTGTNALRILTSNGTTNNYTGDGTSGIYLWGAQLETGAFPTSYIPTTTAAATRSADVASITGSAFSSWYRQDEGTVFADAAGVGNIGGATRRYCEIRDAASSERLVLGYSATNNNRFLVVDNSVTVADILRTGLPTAKTAATYKLNSFQLASNGALGTEDGVGTVPTPDQMQIGSQDGSIANTFLNGTIRRLTFWPQRLANSTLQTLTQ